MRGAIRRPTVGGAACWIPNQSLGQISIKPKMLSFKSLGLDLRIPPLYLSPGLRSFRRPGPKIRQLPTWTLFFWIFGLSKTSSKICFQKSSKKMRKSKFLASQNPPKTYPKCLQNRSSKKHRFFQGILL